MGKLFIAGTDIDGIKFSFTGCYQSFDRANARCKTAKCFVGEVEPNKPQHKTLEGWAVVYPKA